MSSSPSSLDNSVDLPVDLDLEPEDYYAFLFARCDPENKGCVKVTDLLHVLGDFQLRLNESMPSPNNSFGNENSCNEELDKLQKVLDPRGQNPEITLEMFAQGMTAYLETKEHSCLSPVKRSDSCYLNRSSSFIHGTPQTPGEAKPSQLNMSTISISYEDGEFEFGSPRQRDWQAENTDLRLQLEKFRNDNETLKDRIKEAQDENTQLLIQCEELNKLKPQLMELKVKAEQVEQLQAELNEKKTAMALHEEKIAKLENKNTRLRNQSSLYQTERTGLRAENEELKKEAKKLQDDLTAQKELIAKLKASQCLAAKEWEDKEKVLGDHNDALGEEIKQLKLKISEMEEKLAAKLEESTFNNNIFEDSSFLDIQTEFMVSQAEKNLTIPSPADRFDVAVQTFEDIPQSKSPVVHSIDLFRITCSKTSLILLLPLFLLILISLGSSSVFQEVSRDISSCLQRSGKLIHLEPPEI